MAGRPVARSATLADRRPNHGGVFPRRMQQKQLPGCPGQPERRLVQLVDSVSAVGHAHASRDKLIAAGKPGKHQRSRRRQSGLHLKLHPYRLRMPMHRDPLEAVIAANLKIVLVSRNHDTGKIFRSFFQLNGKVAPQRVVEGGVEQARLIAEKDRPDVLVIEGTRHDESELLMLEPTVLREPGMSVVVVSKNESSEYLRLGMRIGLREILPLPLSMEALLRTVSRYHDRAGAVGRPAGSRIYCFIGCKGGSGTTFLATNLGYALACQGRRVALFDLNIHSGDAAVYVSDRTPKFTLADVTRAVARLDGTLLASSMLHVMSNFHVLPAPEDTDQ